MNLDELWEKVLGELEVEISKANFTTWFRDTKILDENDGVVVIGVPNSFSKEWLENKYRRQIVNSLGKHLPQLKQLVFEIGSSISNKKSNRDVIPKQVSVKKEVFETNLNPNHCFENFVVGNNSRLASATSQAVASKPGTLYNPLFIYGGVGLGKTHLIHAIGNQILKDFPDKKVLYVSCESFTNEFVNAISSNKIKDFKKKYREVDVFLVDDIQFLSHKEGTQEQFFHTFNTLHQNNHQIVVTSDRVPKAIPELEDRLSSRFGWGMVADIQPPNLETRIAIIRRKAQERQIALDDEIINFVAQNIVANIRELEGAITRIASHAQLYQENLSISGVKDLMADFIDKQKNSNTNSESISKAVCRFFNIKEEELVGKRRQKELVYPRQITMYLMRHELNLSFPQIGRELGGKDHTTVMYAVDKISKEAARDDVIKSDLSTLREMLYGGS